LNNFPENVYVPAYCRHVWRAAYNYSVQNGPFPLQLRDESLIFRPGHIPLRLSPCLLSDFFPILFWGIGGFDIYYFQLGALVNTTPDGNVTLSGNWLFDKSLFLIFFQKSQAVANSEDHLLIVSGGWGGQIKKCPSVDTEAAHEAEATWG